MANTQKKLKIIAFIFLTLTVLSIIAVIITPIILKKNIESNYRDKTIPSKDNINIWAKYPGEIKSKTTHTFKLLDYSQDSLQVKDSLILEEKTMYDNFEYKDNNKIKFDAKSYFNIEEPKPKNDSIKSINMGMFETLEYFSNPAKYQIGINSILYLFNKVLVSSDLFIRKIYSYYLFINLLNDEAKVRETILKDIDVEKADKILSSEEIYEKYSFKKLPGFYNWIKILNIPEKISKSSWLYNLFNLTENDINSILGNNSYLYTNYAQFNMDLSKQFNCLNENYCGNEIFYKQLLTGEVLNFYGLNNISYFYNMLNPDLYPFNQSPELFIFFEEFKQRIKNPEIKYEDYAPNINLFFAILDQSSKISLLSSKISSLFLMINNTNDKDKANEIYNNISLNNIKLISDYVYVYLPKLLIYQEFIDEKGSNHSIEHFAHALSTIAQGIIEKTYGLLRNIKDFYNLILSNFVFDELTEIMLLVKIKKNNKITSIEPDEVCPLIMQLALNDGRKVLTICSDPKTSFNSPETLIKWFDPYYCIIKGESNCDMSLIEHLKGIVYITDEEIKSIYSEEYLGGTIEKFDQNFIKAFECSSRKECTDEYLSKLQFWKSGITSNLPYNKTNTLADLFPDKIPYPVEIYYYAKEFDYTGDILEEDVDYLFKLYIENGDILDEENLEAFKTKIDLEKKYSLKKGEKDNTLFNIIHLLNKGFLFDKEIKGDYKNIYNILQGNYLDDKKYIEFLSQGNIYEGYKPNLNHTTGFNFGFNLSNGELLNNEFDKYEISAEENNLRKILNINNYEILNLKKLEYDYTTKDYSYITTELLNYESLSNNKQFSDGFQYESSEEVIYLYDKISSIPFKFNYKDEEKYDDINCEKYELDKDDIYNNINGLNVSNSKKVFLSQKLNKPFIVTVGKDGLNINENIQEDNYICVDPFTNMVVQSKINLVYSLYSKDYGYINPNIENNKIYPVFIYQKVFEMDADSYIDYFPDVTFYHDFRTVFIISGIALIVIFAIITLIAFIKIHKNLVNQEFKMNSYAGESLINDSREQTIMGKPD